MTAARQTRKRQRRAAGALLSGILALLPAAKAPATERIVVDWHTGLAIGGYDPVGFYTESKPVAGSPDIEYRMLVRSGGSAMLATAKLSPPTPTSICRSSAAMTRSASPTALRLQAIQPSG